MVPRRRAMHVARLILVTIIAAVSVASGVQAEPQGPLGHEFTLEKVVTPADGVDVGDEVTITLTFRNRWVKDAEVKVTDINPNPAWFEIVQSSIQGGAVYQDPVPQVPEGVVWDNVLKLNDPHVVSFNMKVLGGAGQKATNTAYLDMKQPEASIPQETASVDIFIKPAAPVVEEIDNDDGDDRYLVAWSEVTGAVAYELQESDNLAFDPLESVYAGTDSQVELVDRAPGTWYYRVVAVAIGSVSRPSNTRSATVVMGVPQLRNIENPDGEPDYLVEWSEVTGAASYTLEEDEDPSFGTPTTVYLGDKLKYQVEDQADGTWHYRVRANGPGGISSAWSLPKSTRVGGGVARVAFLPVMIRIWPPVPETPTLQPILNPGGIGDYAVNWSTAARTKTYILEEATDSAFQVVSNTYVTAETRYEVPKQGASRRFYRVKSRNPSGESDWSNIQKVDILWEKESNDSAAQADGPIMSGLTYFGTFPPGATDVSDYFYLEVPAGRSVEIRLTNIPAGQNYDLVLRDTNLNTKGYSAQLGNNDEYINVSVSTGRYLIQVFHRDGDGSSQPYHLQAVYE